MTSSKIKWKGVSFQYDKTVLPCPHRLPDVPNLSHDPILIRKMVRRTKIRCVLKKEVSLEVRVWKGTRFQSKRSPDNSDRWVKFESLKKKKLSRVDDKSGEGKRCRTFKYVNFNKTINHLKSLKLRTHDGHKLSFDCEQKIRL